MPKTVLLVGLVVVAMAAVVVLWSFWRFTGAMADDVRRLHAEARPVGTVITEAMLAGLPPPAQRYFRLAGVVGKPIPAVVTLKQRGRIRSTAESGWMELEAEETYSTNPPAFVWRVWFPRPALPVVLGRDAYLDGGGSILMKLLGVYTVADEHGEELGAAGLMRYFNEMMWFPAAYLGSNVAIAPVDDGAFTATITDRGMTATATLFVDGEGRLTNFRARRFSGATRALETWETPMDRWGERAGLNVPVAGKAIWKLATGDFNYIELEIADVGYDEAPAQ